MWPSETLYQELHAAKRFAPARFLDPTHAVVVPAFEMVKSPDKCLVIPNNTKEEDKPKFQQNQCTIDSVPQDFGSIRTCWSSGLCRPFDLGGNPEGHASTGYNFFFQNKEMLRPLPCFRSNRFEPYLVLPMGSATPLYEEEFRGYGKNKIQHTVHLLAIGFTFSVLSEAFVIHFPHARSEARLTWDVSGGATEATSSAPSQRVVSNNLYLRYLDWLSLTYGGDFGGADELHRGNGAASTQSSANSGAATLVHNFVNAAENDSERRKRALLVLQAISGDERSSADSLVLLVSYRGNETVLWGKLEKKFGAHALRSAVVKIATENGLQVPANEQSKRKTFICDDVTEAETWTERNRAKKPAIEKLDKATADSKNKVRSSSTSKLAVFTGSRRYEGF